MLTPSSRSIVALLLLASLGLSGCHGWRAQANPPSGALPNPARITRTDDSVLVLRDAAVSHDSIVGQAGRSRVATPLSQVRRIDARRVDGARTALLGAGVVVGLFGLVVWAVSSVPPSPGPY